jgi:hypothetical protein
MIPLKNRVARPALTACLVLTFVAGAGARPAMAGQSVEDRLAVLSDQVAQLNALIVELRSEVVKSRGETQELRLQLQKVLDAAGEAKAPVITVRQDVQDDAGEKAANAPPEERLALLEESQQILADRLAEHYQTKVESASRYRTKLSGVVLLNAFSNRGRVDNLEVPDLALRPVAGETGVTRGMTALQSQLGFETYGPEWGGGRVSAGLQMDFFGISPNSPYSSSWGAVRLRSALVRVDWARTSVVVGQDAPFLSPLSPSSVASLGYPAFSYSGNLWTWLPQARIDHRVRITGGTTMSIQGGVFDPVARGSHQPGYGTRLAFSRGEEDQQMTVGFGAHYNHQERTGGHEIGGWGGMADWSIPLGDQLAFSGEFFRGKALGGLGASQGRSVLFGGPEADPSTPMIGLNATGGWAQMKFKATSSVEFNAAHGEDHARRRDLVRFTPTSSTSAISRNRTEMLNVIYRPRTDLLFSLEYRRFKTSRINAPSDTADHFNVGVGVLF